MKCKVWIKDIDKKVCTFLEERKYEITLVFLIFIGKIFINSFLGVCTQNTGGDEIGTIAGMTILSGYDWSEMISQTNYYGFGYSILMTPAFMFIKSPILLYQTLLAYNAFCLAMSALCAYKILTNFWGVKKRDAAWLAAASVTFVNNVLLTNTVANESALILIMWVCLYVLNHLVYNRENGKKVTGLSGALAFLLSYGLLVHTRIIYFWGMMIVFVFFYFVIRKKVLVNLPSFLSIFLLGVFINRKIIRHVQNLLWKKAGENVLDNSIESLGGILERYQWVFKYNGFKATVFTFVGEIWGTMSLTGGILLVALILMTVIVLKRKDWEHSVAMVCTTVSVFAVYIAIIVSVSLGAAHGVYNEATQGIASKWYIYVRYTALVMGPIFMITLYKMVSLNYDMIKKYIRIAAGVFIFTHFVFIIKIAPKFIGIRNDFSGEYLNYILLMGMKYGDEFSVQGYIRIVLLSSLLFSLIIYGYKKRNSRCVIILVLIYNCFSAFYITLNSNSIVSNHQQEKFEEFFYIVNELQNGEEKNTIILRHNESPTYSYVCRFFFGKNEIEYWYDETERDETFLFSSVDLDGIYSDGYYRIADSQDSFMYIKGDILYQKAIESGYELYTR